MSLTKLSQPHRSWLTGYVNFLMGESELECDRLRRHWETGKLSSLTPLYSFWLEWFLTGWHHRGNQCEITHYEHNGRRKHEKFKEKIEANVKVKWYSDNLPRSGCISLRPVKNERLQYSKELLYSYFAISVWFRGWEKTCLRGAWIPFSVRLLTPL